MSIFKRKAKGAADGVTVLKCPSSGCSFSCSERHMMERHLEWKHPDLAVKKQ